MNKPINAYIKTINKTFLFQTCQNLSNLYSRFKYIEYFPSTPSKIGKDNFAGSIS